MTQHDPMIRIQHMCDHVREALGIVKGKTRDHLDTDRLLTLALTHLVEIVGESASWVPDDIQKINPQVPWADVIGMRNRLIHGYDLVNLDILWDTLAIDFPPLLAELDRILSGS